jgi:hypothetical protein
MIGLTATPQLTPIEHDVMVVGFSLSRASKFSNFVFHVRVFPRENRAQPIARFFARCHRLVVRTKTADP